MFPQKNLFLKKSKRRFIPIQVTEPAHPFDSPSLPTPPSKVSKPKLTLPPKNNPNRPSVEKKRQDQREKESAAEIYTPTDSRRHDSPARRAKKSARRFPSFVCRDRRPTSKHLPLGALAGISYPVVPGGGDLSGTWESEKSQRLCTVAAAGGL